MRRVAVGVLAGLLGFGCSAKEGPVERSAPPRSESPTAEAEEAEADAAPAEAVIGPEPKAAVVVTEASEAHLAVQTAMHGEALPEHENVHFAAIEDPSGKAMHAFHNALANLKAGKAENGKVRVAFYGASSVAADRYPAYLRGYLQHRFGDGGVGFVALVPLWRWHRHDAVRVTASKHWRIEHGQRKKGKLDGYYGLLGASAHADHKRATTTIQAKSKAVSKIADSDQFELQYLAQPDGGSFTLSLGPKKSATTFDYETAAQTLGVQYEAVELPEAFLPLRLDVKGDGEVRLMGGIFEREQPGVVVDALGIGGTRSANMTQWDSAMWSDALKRRDPALYILAYGANESVDDDEAIEIYRKDLETVLDRFAKAAPNASCLLVGPVDYPLRDEETQVWGVRPRLREILTIQRETAAARGCGFFDTSRLTGGLGSMPDWVAADPQLAKDDHLHLSPLGYLYFGRVLSDALMADFDGPARVPRP